MIRSIALQYEQAPTWAKNVVLVVGASLVLGLFANVAIPLPFTPVPVVTQNSMVLLLAVLLGSKRAVAAVTLFLAQAAMGLPVCAGGTGGIAKFAGPTAGYLLGYLVAAFVVGKLMETRKRSAFNVFWTMGIGNALMFLFGAAWLSSFIGPQKAIALGVTPFILGDLIKLLLSQNILQWVGYIKPRGVQN